MGALFISTVNANVSVNVSTYMYTASTSRPPPPPNTLGALVSYEQNVFSRSLKAASVKFGLRTESVRLFQADGPATAAVRVESVTRYVQ